MVYRTCDPYTLCGISSCFRLLSRTQRQIAHALLTRPPLIRGRSPVTVRLECVMHAASVHPEPGSNSLKIVIHLSYAQLNPFQSAISSFLYSFEFLNVFLTRFLHTYRVTKILLFNFQRSIRVVHKLSSWQRPHYSTTPFSVCQELFEKSFSFSSLVFCAF